MSRYPAMLTILILLAGAPAHADTQVRKEAEAYHACIDIIDDGGDPIHVGYCSSASEDFCVDGVDMPGDWIQLNISIPVTGAFDAFLAFQAVEFSGHQFLLEIWPAGEPQRVESVLFDFIGEGVG